MSTKTNRRTPIKLVTQCGQKTGAKIAEAVLYYKPKESRNEVKVE
jgi:hypothetical protein